MEGEGGVFVAYRIRISIMGIESPVWRRLRVPGHITFGQLHRIIQVAFGWLDYHLYSFKFGNAVVTEPSADFPSSELYGEEAEMYDPAVTLVSQLLDKYKQGIYEYDFGDSWLHEIVVEKKLRDTKANARPVCLAGARHRPPEDVGGLGGYQEFLQTIGETRNPERKNMLAWAEKDTRGRLFDPEYFSLEEINRRLAYALEDDRERAEELLASGPGLVGTLKFGWWEPYIEMDGHKYTWERIGDLLAWLEEGVIISIKATIPKQKAR